VAAKPISGATADGCVRKITPQTTEGSEVIYRRGPWRSFEAVEFATLEWVDWFNNRRLLEPIKYTPA
jgi:transposase InsO family protein